MSHQLVQQHQVEVTWGTGQKGGGGSTGSVRGKQGRGCRVWGVRGIQPGTWMGEVRWLACRCAQLHGMLRCCWLVEHWLQPPDTCSTTPGTAKTCFTPICDSLDAKNEPRVVDVGSGMVVPAAAALDAGDLRSTAVTFFICLTVANTAGRRAEVQGFTSHYTL